MNTYRPYTKEDKLESGTKIRLGGREGEIDYYLNNGTCEIVWCDGDSDTIFLDRFPNIEIEDIPPPPLKIDKRVKEEIIKKMSDARYLLLEDEYGKACNEFDEIYKYLNSLEEV